MLLRNMEMQEVDIFVKGAWPWSLSGDSRHSDFSGTFDHRPDPIAPGGVACPRSVAFNAGRGVIQYMEQRWCLAAA